jgi:hypothetical protein
MTSVDFHNFMKNYSIYFTNFIGESYCLSNIVPEETCVYSLILFMEYSGNQTELYVPHKLIFDKYEPNTFYPVDEMNNVSDSWHSYKIIKNPTKEIIIEELNKIIGFIKTILVRLKIKEIDKDFE